MISLGAALGTRQVEGRGLRGGELGEAVDGRGELAGTEAGDMFSIRINGGACTVTMDTKQS